MKSSSFAYNYQGQILKTDLEWFWYEFLHYDSKNNIQMMRWAQNDTAKNNEWS